MPKQERPEIILSEDDKKELTRISKSRSESSARVLRSKMIIDYSKGDRVASIVGKYGTNRPLVQRTIDKALNYGPITALDDLPRSGRPAEITDEAKSWVLSLACEKPTKFNLAAQRWTYRLLVNYIRKHCTSAGHECLRNTGKSFLNGILSKSNIKPHKVSYYLERRDPDFEAKMAAVLCVYKEVAMINNEDLCAHKSTTVSYDEKPGIQAIKNLAPELLPVPNSHSCLSRDYEYKRLGTVSLLAAIDLHTGKVIPLVRDRHRSKEFIEFLKELDKQYPQDWKIRVVLDNHSSHISKETQSFLKSRPNKFDFVFTPKHGSWLNMIEVFFSKVARSFLRHIRVESKEELVQRIYKGIEEINAEPVIFKWKYKMDDVNLC